MYPSCYIQISQLLYRPIFTTKNLCDTRDYRLLKLISHLVKSHWHGAYYQKISQSKQSNAHDATHVV